MQHESPIRTRDAAPSVGSDEFAEGLMLVRASALKMIRLQLAMERHDRRVAMEAVEDLVEIDRRLEDYLADVSAPLMVRRELEAERGAVNREKLTLAAGVIRREPPAPEIEAETPAPDFAAPEAAASDEFEFAPGEPERPYRAIKWIAAALLLLSASAWTAYMLVDPGTFAAMAAQFGALR